MALPIGSIVSGGVGLIKGIFGGSKAAKQRKKMDRYLNQQDAENTAYYNSNYLSDYTQRSDAQNLMKQLRDNLSKVNKRSENMAVVTGATPEQQAIAKEQANKVISDTYSNLGAMGQQWKDQISNRYLTRRENIANQRMGVMGEKAQSYETMRDNGLDQFSGALGGILGNFGSGGGAASGGAGALMSQLAGSGGLPIPMA